MRYTREDVVKEYKKAQKRLETFSKHTGFQYKIDKNILSKTHRKQAIEYLKSIKWTDINKLGIKEETKMFKNIDVIVKPEGPASYDLQPFKIEDKKQAARLIRVTKTRRLEETKFKKANKNANIELFKPNPWTSKNIEETIEYAKKYNFETLAEWVQNRNEHAKNNYVNNMYLIAQSQSDVTTIAAGMALAHLIETGAIDIIKLTSDGKNKWIWDLVAVNMFDSKQNNIDHASGKRIINNFKSRGYLNDDMIVKAFLEAYTKNTTGRVNITVYQVYDALKEFNKSKKEIKQLFEQYHINYSRIEELK